MSPEAERIIRTLGLVPHPEGGYYAETFRAHSTVDSTVHEGTRSAVTTIYFLLTASDFSAFHCVLSDEVWCHYAGDPLALFLLDPQAGLREHRLGGRLDAGERPQAVAPRGVLQAARVLPGSHGYTLCGCVVAPGFEFADFTMPVRAQLTAAYPDHAALIASLTR
jgi:uncharacterized protein